MSYRNTFLAKGKPFDSCDVGVVEWKIDGIIRFAEFVEDGFRSSETSGNNLAHL